MADFDMSVTASDLGENCTRIPGEYLEELLKTSEYGQTGISVAYGLICAVGLFANALVLFLLFTGGKKGATFQAPSTILVLNLVVADTLFLLTLPFSMSHRLEDRWKFGDAMCKFEEGVKFLNYYGSVFFITAMAVDRYYVLSRPGYVDRKTARRSLCVASICLWLLALVAVIPLLVFAGVDSDGYCSIMFPHGPNFVGNVSHLLEAMEDIECIENYIYLANGYDPESYEVTNREDDYSFESVDIGDYASPIDESWTPGESAFLCKHVEFRSLHAWLVWNFVIGFVAPFFLITFSYARIMMMPFPGRHHRSAGATTSNDTTSRNGTNDGKSMNASESGRKYGNGRAKMLLNVMVPCLIAAFLVCWLPYHIFHLVQIRGVKMKSEITCHVIRDVTFCLAFFNSALNPMLNSFFLYNFKNRIQKSRGWLSGRLKRLSSKGTVDTEESEESRDVDDTVLAQVTLVTNEETALNNEHMSACVLVSRSPVSTLAEQNADPDYAKSTACHIYTQIPPD